MYFEASTGVAGYIGYGTPEDKRVYPCRELTLIGIGIDLDRAIRYLDHDKATRYATGDVEAALRMARDSGARDVVRLHVPSETRDLSQVPPTWA
jgi:hypothetical protein